MLIYLFILSSLFINIVRGQLESPCPDVLNYLDRNQDELNTWSAIVTFKAFEDSEKLSLTIILDRKAENLASWFAKSVTQDNIEYSLRASYRLKAGDSQSIKFFVIFTREIEENTYEAVVGPRVEKILLNGEWPWHAALYRQRGTELLYTCGGTLISHQHIVTAAHCVTKPRTNSLVDKQVLVVYLGKYNLVSFRGEVQDRDIDQIIVHPEYNYTVFYNDIAILKLDSPVEFNDFIRPCCLWDDDTNDIENVVGSLGTVVGWGFDENKQLSRNLMQAQMPIVSTSMCLFSNRNFFSQFISDKNFCAGFKNGTSACNGDSGGGMVIHKWSTRGLNTVWQLRGLVSVGVALQGQGVCGTIDTNQYIVFTDAAKYVQWIRQTINL